MTPAAISLFVYGIFLLANGVGLLCTPNLLLSLLGLPSTEEPWVRVLGLVAGEIGFYFVFAARKGVTSLFQATVHARGAAAITFVALVVLKLGPIQLLFFAALDVVFAIWTHFAAKRTSEA
jgi:hypothetical protein